MNQLILRAAVSIVCVAFLPVFSFKPTYADTISLGFDNPVAVTSVGGQLFVLEKSGQISVVETDGAPSIVRTIAEPGSGAAQLSAPEDLVADPWGGVVVADTGNGRLARFLADGTWVGEVHVEPYPQRVIADSSHVYSLRFGQNGLTVDSFDTQLHLESSIDVSSTCPYRDFAAVMGAMAMDNAGAIWVGELTGCGENYVLRRYRTDGTLLGSWSRAAGQLSADTLQARGYQVWLISDLFVVGDKLYVILGSGGTETGGIDLDVWSTTGSFQQRVRINGPARPMTRGTVTSADLVMPDPIGTQSLFTVSLSSLP